jgi:tellurite methyltransferase
MVKSYDKEYQTEKLLWGSEPSIVAKELLNHRKEGSVLDIGMGEGRDVLFLAEKGFKVTGIDLSKVAVNKCLDLSEKNNLDVDLLVGDYLDYYPKNRFNIIISNCTLHLLDQKDVPRAIIKMKKMTRNNGLNIISVFSEKDDSNVSHKFKIDELKEFYKDWNILKYEEFSTSLEKHGSSEEHTHEGIIIVAEKVKSL